MSGREPRRRRLGRYVIDGELGRGGMGVVYRAHRADLPRQQVALKTLRPDRRGDAALLERFRYEISVAARVSGPGVPRLLDFDLDHHPPYFALELLEGPTLAEILRTGPLPPEVAARLGADLAATLARAHDAGVVHRDVKPGNVLMVGEVPHLLDFGIALDAELGHLTRTGGASPCTRRYAAPEVLAGNATAPEEVRDIYALGVLLADALRPAPRPAVDRSAPVSVRAPATLASLVRAMTEPDPRERPTMRDVARILDGMRSSGRQSRRRLWWGSVALVASVGCLWRLTPGAGAPAAPHQVAFEHTDALVPAVPVVSALQAPPREPAAPAPVLRPPPRHPPPDAPPAAEPSPPALAEVRHIGDPWVSVVLAREGIERPLPCEVHPGTYRVCARFGDDLVEIGWMTLRPGDRVSVECRSPFQNCRWW